MPLDIDEIVNTDLEIKPAAKSKLHAYKNLFSLKKNIDVKDRMFFTEQLALLLEAGVSLPAALRALRSQAAKQSLVELLDHLIADIDEGKSFSTALAAQPNAFPSTYVNLVMASETGGFMNEVLQQLLVIDQKKQELQASLVSAFSYPIFLLIFSLIVILFVLTFIFPKFQDIFADIQDQLPITTTVLMFVSSVITGYMWQLVVATIAAVMAFIYWARGPGSYTIDYLKLRLPLVKDIYTKYYLIQLLRTMSLSLQHGVSLVDTLEACKKITANKIFLDFIEELRRRLQEGIGIASGFGASPMIPPVVKQMINTGEETGSLDKVMGKLADHYEVELARLFKLLTRFAEPVLLIIMGLIVGLIVSSLILPIFKLSQVVR